MRTHIFGLHTAADLCSCISEVYSNYKQELVLLVSVPYYSDSAGPGTSLKVGVDWRDSLMGKVIDVQARGP